RSGRDVLGRHRVAVRPAADGPLRQRNAELHDGDRHPGALRSRVQQGAGAVTRRAHKRGPRGFSIIEALIASIVMLVGLLGLAAPHADGSSYTADFSDGTANATKTAALDAAFCTPNPPGCPYTGLSGDVDGDGVLDYQRYWNVWTTSFDGSTTTGKFIQVIVRWKEPVLGYRQISVSTFKEIPNQLDTGL